MKICDSYSMNRDFIFDDSVIFCFSVFTVNNRTLSDSKHTRDSKIQSTLGWKSHPLNVILDLKVFSDRFLPYFKVSRWNFHRRVKFFTPVQSLTLFSDRCLPLSGLNKGVIFTQQCPTLFTFMMDSRIEREIPEKNGKVSWINSGSDRRFKWDRTWNC